MSQDDSNNQSPDELEPKEADLVSQREGSEQSAEFSDMASALASSVADQDSNPEDGFSLEELSQSYSTALQSQASAKAGPGDDADAGPDSIDIEDEEIEIFENSTADDERFPVTPLSIVEAILFVGRSNSVPISASEIAKLMRGVTESQVVGLVSELNQIYQDTDRAIVIQQSSGGYQAVLAEDLGPIRERFYGKVRTVSLNQAAIDCLALIAYQPGISRARLDEQRGTSSGGVLNQLVRRQLIEIHREAHGKRTAPHYYPSDKLLELAGLETLEDLPQVEDFE